MFGSDGDTWSKPHIKNTILWCWLFYFCLFLRQLPKRGSRKGFSLFQKWGKPPYRPLHLLLLRVWIFYNWLWPVPGRVYMNHYFSLSISHSFCDTISSVFIKKHCICIAEASPHLQANHSQRQNTGLPCACWIDFLIGSKNLDSAKGWENEIDVL